MASRLGEGTFGIVYAATSPNSKRECAIKRNLAEDKVSFISVLREIDVLYAMCGHPHIVNLWKLQYGNQHEIFSPLNNRTLPRRGQRNDHFHFIFPRARSDLLSLLSVSPDYRLYKFYMAQLLLGLNYLHINGYIHRDIKPQNILIFEEDGGFMSVKLSDFGLTKPFTKQGTQTPNTVTPWYRAPEIALGNPHYDSKSDVWSLGCVFYELISHQPFIKTSQDDNDQILNAIICRLPQKLSVQKYREILLKNPWRTVQLSPSARRCDPLPLASRMNLTPRSIVQFEDQAGSYEQFCNMLSRMLTFDHLERANCLELLNDEFFDVHQPYINKVLNRWPVLKIKDDPLIIYEGIERNWLAKEITYIFNNRKNYSWYSPRILFMTINIVHIYLNELQMKKAPDTRAIESMDRGKLTSHHNLVRTVYCAIYMAIKYYSTLHVPIRYEDVFPRKYHNRVDKDMVCSTELNLLMIMEYRIYRPTVYELADHENIYLEDEDVCRLLYILTQNENINKVQPSCIIRNYCQHLRTTNDFNVLKTYNWTH